MQLWMSMDMRGVQNARLSLSTLGALTAIFSATKIDAARLEGCKPEKLKWNMDWLGKTTSEGPIYYGVCGGMTIADVAAFFASDPQHVKDDVPMAQSLESILILGVMPFTRTALDVAEATKWRTTQWPGWHVIEGEDINVFAFNADSGALSTGTVIDWQMQWLGDWLLAK